MLLLINPLDTLMCSLHIVADCIIFFLSVSRHLHLQLKRASIEKKQKQNTDPTESADFGDGANCSAELPPPDVLAQRIRSWAGEENPTSSTTGAGSS